MVVRCTSFVLLLVVALALSLCGRERGGNVYYSFIDGTETFFKGKDAFDERIPSKSKFLHQESFELLVPAMHGKISSQILVRLGYVTSYNHDTKCPNWVAWHLKGEDTDGPYRRLGYFHEDEEVPSPRATLDDYRGSGWSRGHMCPAGDNKWNARAMYESFSLVNVCPQNANLNSGLWNSIEIDCRRWARQYDDIYIVCGPLFLNQEHEAIGINKVVVPEAFFKVVLCLNGKPKGLGFIVRNTDGNKKRDLYYNSIDQVERITGYDFFPILPDSLENIVESTCNINDW